MIIAILNRKCVLCMPWQHWTLTSLWTALWTIDDSRWITAKMASVFSDLEMAPPIEVFKMVAEFNADPHPEKVNLSVGGMFAFFARELELTFGDCSYSIVSNLWLCAIKSTIFNGLFQMCSLKRYFRQIKFNQMNKVIHCQMITTYYGLHKLSVVVSYFVLCSFAQRMFRTSSSIPD